MTSIRVQLGIVVLMSAMSALWFWWISAFGLRLGTGQVENFDDVLIAFWVVTKTSHIHITSSIEIILHNLKGIVHVHFEEFDKEWEVFRNAMRDVAVRRLFLRLSTMGNFLFKIVENRDCSSCLVQRP